MCRRLRFTHFALPLTTTRFFDFGHLRTFGATGAVAIGGGVLRPPVPPPPGASASARLRLDDLGQRRRGRGGEEAVAGVATTIGWEPAAAKLVLQVALPLGSSAAASQPGMTAPPSVKEKVPLLGGGETVAVNVTCWPVVDGLAEEERAIVVAVTPGGGPVSTAPASQADLPVPGRG